MNNPEITDIDDNFYDFYKSINSLHREDDANLVSILVQNNVIPTAIRYGIMKNVYRGVVKDVNENLYYFNYVPNNDSVKLVKADDKTKIWEANKLFKSCNLGCDIIKAEIVDEDDEDEEKAVGSGPGATGGNQTGGHSGGTAPITEAQAVAQQNTLLTEEHPGAATAETPDLPNVGRDWHGDNAVKSTKIWTHTDLLKSLGQTLKSTALVINRKIDPKERQYLVEVLGRTPYEVDNGNSRINSAQRAQYNLWLTKSLQTQLNKLENWVKK